ncbi:hypothetical protein [Crossiella sp. NPDC003009]
MSRLHWHPLAGAATVLALAAAATGLPVLAGWLAMGAASGFATSGST